ncbi:glucose-6-phosphate isomerase [Nautilia profundicola AmH]|uniref:Glucose-6-phosphate isomerase n=1 Tax=Nautilia profundicola (strain ATCC BAA-1463 / DSM 18972 / AmH) TaxID=598659 RepID=B9L8R8_NAUPA|nr:glucose-6-phosphate isomerase [Nautilia profundicola]ACM92420.1 glucose-6-phosphate isomerase [Nautilia profundicola AmH]
MLKFNTYYDYENKNLETFAYESLVKEKESGEIGYYHLPKNSMDLLNELDNINYNFEKIAVIGIGGSSLGTKAIYRLLKSNYKNVKEIVFLENTDPIELKNHFSKIDKNNTLFLVISKSGTTIETISIFKAAIDYFKLDLSNDKIIVITDPASNLEKFADKYSIKVFNIPKNVGGRFSVFSAVGVVPLYLAGFDVKKVLKGADEFFESFFNKSEWHLIRKAAFLYERSRCYKMNVVFSYSSLLDEFNKWYVQLWGESLGKINKKGGRVGLTPIGLLGSIDQHSFLQLLIEGPRDKTVTFIKVKNFENSLKIPNISLPFLETTDFVNGYTFNELINAQCDATRESVVRSGIDVDEIVLEKLNEENVGMLLVYYELLTSAVGALFEINTYNQPGVEFGKKILKTKFNS